ncbi:MAG: HAD family hydrolase [Gammaproteobacteria bacterium]|nr:MAG: HAD family hydrolase [Gammaproteobacteria bacterium]
MLSCTSLDPSEDRRLRPLRRPDAVLFDLDGTLADTAPDLAYALNETLRHFGHPPLPFQAIRPVVSHGGIALIRLGFGMEPDDPGFEERRAHLLQVYQDNLCRETRLFEGMPEVLDELERRQIRWGIVTNKPSWLTEPLVQALGLAERTPAIVSGDTCPERKPHPMPLLHACRLLAIDPGHCWYLGDAGRDMQAARAAGAVPVGATFGYIYPDDPVEGWDSDRNIDRPAQLIDLIARSAVP